jgi:hypothetical protein
MTCNDLDDIQKEETEHENDMASQRAFVPRLADRGSCRTLMAEKQRNAIPDSE